jgi:uncharacterized protein
VLMPYVDREWLAALPAGVDVPVAALLGLPLYVCATGSTPLAAMLMVQGLSPGAALALMLTGPATNVTTFGMLARLHGSRVAVLFAAAMWAGTVALGLLVNWLLPHPPIAALVAGHAHEGTLAWLALGALAIVFALSLLRQGVRPFLERLFESPANLAHGETPGCCPGDDHGPHHHHHHGHDHHHDHGHAHGHGHPDRERFVAAPAQPLAPARPAPVERGGDPRP